MRTGSSDKATPPHSTLRHRQAHAELNAMTFSDLAAEEAEQFRWQAEKVALIETVLRGLRLRGTLGDVGCFTGIATERYRATGFDSAVGFDLAPQALQRASKRGLEARAWAAGREPCPARDNEFSAVVAADVIEHIVDTDYFLEEINRIICPGGYVIVTTPNLGFWISRLRLLAGRAPWGLGGPSSSTTADSKVDLNHIRVTLRSEWETLFRTHGLRVERTLGCSLLRAMGDAWSIRWRRAIDSVLKRRPELALILLFLLRTPAA